MRRLANDGFDKSQLLAVNTDVRQLKLLDAEGIPALLIGTAVTRGRGTGGDVKKGQDAAIEDKEAIAQAVAGADLVFLTAGMGKGVGTGATPVVAKIAHDMGILTVGMVTMPFSHEGERKTTTAQAGVELLRQNMDAAIYAVMKDGSCIKLDGVGTDNMILQAETPIVLSQLDHILLEDGTKLYTPDAYFDF